MVNHSNLIGRRSKSLSINGHEVSYDTDMKKFQKYWGFLRDPVVSEVITNIDPDRQTYIQVGAFQKDNTFGRNFDWFDTCSTLRPQLHSSNTQINTLRLHTIRNSMNNSWSNMTNSHIIIQTIDVIRHVLVFCAFLSSSLSRELCLRGPEMPVMYLQDPKWIIFLILILLFCCSYTRLVSLLLTRAYDTA